MFNIYIFTPTRAFPTKSRQLHLNLLSITAKPLIAPSESSEETHPASFPARRRRRSCLLGLFTEFAHNLCDVDVGGHLGLLLLLLLLQDDGAQTGLPVLGVVLQLSIAEDDKTDKPGFLFTLRRGRAATVRCCGARAC